MITCCLIWNNNKNISIVRKQTFDRITDRKYHRNRCDNQYFSTKSECYCYAIGWLNTRWACWNANLSFGKAKVNTPKLCYSFNRMQNNLVAPFEEAMSKQTSKECIAEKEKSSIWSNFICKLRNPNSISHHIHI